jgi:surface carbohydrate biosynthesis protein (TIGR04326 family)
VAAAAGSDADGTARIALIWDADEPPPPGPSTVVLWRTLIATDTDRMLSLPRLVEEDAAALREEYLAWVHDLGNTVIRGARVVDHLQLRRRFSYWWMTTVSHTPNFYDSSRIEDAIKCLAFARLSRARPRWIKLIVVTANERLATVFERYCGEWNIEFERRGRTPMAAVTRSRIRQVLAPMLALLILVRAGVRLFLFSAKERAWTRSAPAGVCLFDMFIYLQPQAVLAGPFESQYWTALTALLRRAGTPTTWVHTYFPHSDVSSLGRARRLVARFNGCVRTEVHGLIDSQLSLRGLGRALRDYLRLVTRLPRLRSIRHAVSASGFNFWPLVADDWYESLAGPSAMRNCVWLAAYECALARLPHQPTGIYILENQPWEMALVHAWRAFGHGQLIGVPHSTVRFWDLRYHYDQRSYERSGGNDLPLPDLVAVNGPAAFREYLAAGYPASQIQEVEALRYLHLLVPHSRPDVARGERSLRILVCGDNIPGSNIRVMDAIVGADARLRRRAKYVFKPHRAAPFDVTPYRTLDIEVRMEPLPDLLGASDVVITGNITSAAVDAFVAGVPVLSLRDGRRLNASPLRDVAGAASFDGAEDLAVQLEAQSQIRAASPDTSSFFCLDAALPRWARLLNISVPGRRANPADAGYEAASCGSASAAETARRASVGHQDARGRSC